MHKELKVMRKINSSIVLFLLGTSLAFGQYYRTWTQEVQTTANRFKLQYDNSAPGNNFLEEYNYDVFGPSYNNVTSFFWDGFEWYIKNEEGFNIESGISFHITKAGINETAFAHSATSQNVDGYRTFINHPELNGNPDAIFLYSHLNSVGIGNDNITGLQYFNDKWSIFNQDLSTSIPLGSDYFIVIPGNQQLTFIHTTSNQNGTSAYSVIDHPDLNGNPSAKLFVSHNLTESINVLNKNIGVYYQPFIEKWSVVTADLSPMPNGHSFNVMIPDGDLDNIPDFKDLCAGYDDTIDRDNDGTPDYCDLFEDLGCDSYKTIYEDHLPGEVLTYVAEFSVTSNRKINTTAQVTFKSDNHILNPGFEVANEANFEAWGTSCSSGN